MSGLYDALSRRFGGFFDTGDAASPPPLHRNPWFWALVGGLLFPPFLHLSGLTRRVPDPPAVQSTLPAFSLVDQDGAVFTRDDLAGHVTIVGFFFSSCVTVCPRILQTMKSVERDLAIQAPYEGYGTDIQLLAITVDPETDDPAVLRQTMAKYDLDPQRWTLLTGPKADVVALVEQGFGAAVGDKEQVQPGVFDIAHSTRLALVDGDGGVRGFYGIEPVSEQRGLSGARLDSDYDGPEAVRGWATVLWHAQRHAMQRSAARSEASGAALK